MTKKGHTEMQQTLSSKKSFCLLSHAFVAKILQNEKKVKFIKNWLFKTKRQLLSFKVPWNPCYSG
jgi:hypothetical protein